MTCELCCDSLNLTQHNFSGSHFEEFSTIHIEEFSTIQKACKKNGHEIRIIERHGNINFKIPKPVIKLHRCIFAIKMMLQIGCVNVVREVLQAASQAIYKAQQEIC